MTATCELGAAMTDFAGWDMPLHYGSVVAEHNAVRESAGMFDLSHLGTLTVTGPGAEATIQRAFTNDASSLAVGRAHYTLCLTEDGGIVDDLLVYQLEWGYFVVPNAANAGAVLGGWSSRRRRTARSATSRTTWPASRCRGRRPRTW